MPPGKPNERLEAYEEAQAFLYDTVLSTGDQPVDPAVAMENLEFTEACALEAATDRRSTGRVWREMHELVLGMADVRYEPPMDIMQRAELAGKVAKYAVLCEITPTAKPVKQTAVAPAPADNTPDQPAQPVRPATRSRKPTSTAGRKTDDKKS